MLKVTVTIKDLAEFKPGFLKHQPVPTGETAMTEEEWITEWIKRKPFEAYETGIRELAQEAASIDENIIE